MKGFERPIFCNGNYANIVVVVCELLLINVQFTPGVLVLLEIVCGLEVFSEGNTHCLSIICSDISVGLDSLTVVSRQVGCHYFGNSPRGKHVIQTAQDGNYPPRVPRYHVVNYVIKGPGKAPKVI